MRHVLRNSVRLGLVALVAGAMTAPAASAAPGAAYTQTNDLSDNQLVVFDRFADGTLAQRQVVSTGGQGSTQDVGCGAGCPILDSSGSVDATENGRLVFAVNAGSNTVSSFRETPNGLVLVDQEPSGGSLPESITTSGDLLYVLNVNSGTISGLRFDSAGNMTPIPGSTRSLASGPAAQARQVSFSPRGDYLVVTELLTSQIDTFAVGKAGTPGPAVAHPSQRPLPFGFDFDQKDHFVVSELQSLDGTGAASSYELTKSGDVIPLDSEQTNAVLPCWVAIPPDGKNAFVVNTGAGAPALVTRFGLARTGDLTFLGNTSAGDNDFAETDAFISRDGKFLYVLAPSVIPPLGSTSHIDEYRIGNDGSLTKIGSTPSNLPPGDTGLDGV